MHPKLLSTVFAAFATVEICVAQSPPRFTPATSNHLTVTYGASAISPAGITVEETGQLQTSAPTGFSEVAEPPKLSLSSSHTGTYLLAMLDLSVEPNNNPAETNTTLLHWLLPSLSSPNETTTALTSQENATAPYFPPGPPAGQTHTYAIFLYQQPADFSIPAEYVRFFENITASVYNRVGFNLTEFVDKTDLGSPVAADWFLVSNTTSNAASSPSSATPTASSTGGMASSSSNSGSTVIKADAIFMVMALGIAGNLLKLL